MVAADLVIARVCGREERRVGNERGRKDDADVPECIRGQRVAPEIRHAVDEPPTRRLRHGGQPPGNAPGMRGIAGTAVKAGSPNSASSEAAPNDSEQEPTISCQTPTMSM